MLLFLVFVGVYVKDFCELELIFDDKYEVFMVGYCWFILEIGDVRVCDVFEFIIQLQYIDFKFFDQFWVVLFFMFWFVIVKEDWVDFECGMVIFLIKDYYFCQIDKRLNVVQFFMNVVVCIWFDCKILFYVFKFMVKIYDVWYMVLYQLEKVVIKFEIDLVVVWESNLDVLVEFYVLFGEEDLFYGIWCRCCQFVESNVVLLYEQYGMWEKVQCMYENV